MREVPFRPGDLVVLKSGGPVMTVAKVGPSPISLKPVVCCVYFAGDEVFKKAFPPHCLTQHSGSTVAEEVSKSL